MTHGLDLAAGVGTIVILALAGRWLLTLTTNSAENLAFQLRLFFVALAIRFAFAFAIYEVGFASILGDYDASGWYYGVSLQSFWDGNGYGLLDLPFAWAGAFYGNHLGYYYVLGTLFFLLGTASRLAAASLNCFFGALTVVFTYRAARTVLAHGVAARVAWWTCLFPSMIIWSAQTLKEPIVIFLEAIALYCCMQLKNRGFSFRHVIICGASIVCMVPFRFYAAYIAAAAVAFALATPYLRRGRFAFGSALGVAALIVPLVLMSGVLASHEASFERFDLDFIQSFRHNIAADSGSGVDSAFDMRTTTGFGAGTAVGALHLLLAPFPWQLGSGSLRMLLTTPELVYWWWLFFFGVIPGLRYMLRRHFAEVQPIVIFVVGLGFLYSMLFGNVGVVFRQRAQILPWLFVFASVGLERRASRRAERIAAHQALVEAVSRTQRLAPGTQHS